MSIPKVSFFMTVKNGMPLIRQSVESLVAQSDADWECVIVDDGSTDGTPEFLRAFALSDSRFRVVLTPGIGRGAALNLALKHVRAPIVANLDSDDLVHPKKVEIQAALMRENQIGFMATKALIVFDDDIPGWDDVDPEGIPVVDLSAELAKGNPIIHSTVMMSSELAMRLGGYDATRKSLLDYELWYRVLRSGQPLYCLDARLAAKRVHRRQSFENKRRLAYLWSTALLMMRIHRGLNLSIYYSFYPWIKFLYGILPQRPRMLLAKYRYKRR